MSVNLSLIAIPISICLGVLLIRLGFDGDSGLAWTGEELGAWFNVSLFVTVAQVVIGLAFGISGMIASSAIELSRAKKLRAVGLKKLLQRVLASTDFAISVLLFPILMLIIIEAVYETENTVLAFISAFQSGFMIKAVTGAMVAQAK